MRAEDFKQFFKLARPRCICSMPASLGGRMKSNLIQVFVLLIQYRISRYVGYEFSESPFYVSEAFIVFEMFAVYIRYYRRIREIIQERPVEFVGFNHQPLRLSFSKVRHPELSDFSPDKNSGVKTCQIG